MAFEAVASELAHRYEGAAAILTDSGTSALSLAIRLALADSGRAVALPAYGCYDLATATDTAGAPFVLYDVDPETLAPVPSSLDAALGEDVGAVVIVHHHGFPVDPDPLRPLLRRSNAMLIDDAAQAAGGTLRGRRLGGLGDLGVLSFGRGKGVTGGGGGALLVPRDSSRAAAASRLRLPRASEPAWGCVAKLAAQWALGRPQLYRVPASMPFLRLGETLYKVPRPATAASPVHVAVLSQTLRIADEDWMSRQDRARRLADALNPPALVPRHAVGASPGYLRLPVLLPDWSYAAGVYEAAAELGVVRGYPTTLADLIGFGSRRRAPDLPLTGARALVDRLITLPTHSAVSAADERRIARWVNRLVQQID